MNTTAPSLKSCRYEATGFVGAFRDHNGDRLETSLHRKVEALVQVELAEQRIFHKLQETDKKRAKRHDYSTRPTAMPIKRGPKGTYYTGVLGKPFPTGTHRTKAKRAASLMGVSRQREVWTLNEITREGKLHRL